MIQHGTAENWYESVKQYLEFYDVSTDALLSYFSPLEQYLNEQETEEVAEHPTELEKNLERLEDQYKKVFNTPTTTTTTSTTMKPATPATQPSNIPKVIKDVPSVTVKSQKIEATSKPDTSGGIQADATKAPEQITTSEYEDVDDYDEKGGKIIKSETNKAVYAVGAVLFATIIIVIISIFGRRRCRKTPKNRRYV